MGPDLCPLGSPLILLSAVTHPACVCIPHAQQMPMLGVPVACSWQINVREDVQLYLCTGLRGHSLMLSAVCTEVTFVDTLAFLIFLAAASTAWKKDRKKLQTARGSERKCT